MRLKKIITAVALSAVVCAGLTACAPLPLSSTAVAAAIAPVAVDTADISPDWRDAGCEKRVSDGILCANDTIYKSIAKGTAVCPAALIAAEAADIAQSIAQEKITGTCSYLGKRAAFTTCGILYTAVATPALSAIA